MRRFRKSVLLCICLSFALTSCAPAAGNTEIQTSGEPAEQILPIAEATVADEYPLSEDKSVYENDDPSSVAYLYVTVTGTGNRTESTHYTLERINQTHKLTGVTNPSIRAECILQEGDANGPKPGYFGYGLTVPNGVIEVRGQTSTAYDEQKSYAVQLTGDSKWRGMSKVALNKHIYDVSRSMNKLVFDLLKDIPGYVSLRTQFVQLFVKDETTDPAQNDFVDYGLYTQIELPNKGFLKEHGFGSEDHLYKVISFAFSENENRIKTVTDPDYDAEEFANVIEPKGNEDHSKLIELIQEVNDYRRDIDSIIEEYFDMDNYTTWMAFSLLVGNQDIGYQNYMLYSPLNSKKWYFFPWDYDASFRKTYEKESGDTQPAYLTGLSRFWTVLLHRRALKSDAFRQALDEKVEYLYNNIITPENIKSKLNVYYPIVSEFVSRPPDSGYLYHDYYTEPGKFDRLWNSIPDLVHENYMEYKNSCKSPMSFFIWDLELTGDGMTARWDEAYDLDGGTVFYDVYIAEDPAIKKIVSEKKALLFTHADFTLPKPGKYYIKVYAYDKDGNGMIANDGLIIQEPYTFYDGVRAFEVTNNSVKMQN